MSRSAPSRPSFGLQPFLQVVLLGDPLLPLLQVVFLAGPFLCERDSEIGVDHAAEQHTSKFSRVGTSNPYFEDPDARDTAGTSVGGVSGLGVFGPDSFALARSAATTGQQSDLNVPHQTDR